MRKQHDISLLHESKGFWASLRVKDDCEIIQGVLNSCFLECDAECPKGANK